MYKLLSKIGKILFHRIGVILVLVGLQIAVYVLLFTALAGTAYYSAVNSLLTVLSVAAVLWIVGNHSNPGYKIGWIIIVLALRPFGAVAYVLLGGNRLSRYSQRRLGNMEHIMKRCLDADCGRSAALEALAGPDAGRMAHYLESRAACPAYANTATRYYPLGDLCYEDILAALRGAKHFIYIEYFIIEEGVLWNSVLEILRDKAAEGVEVRVIYDDIGSIFTLPTGYPARLEKMGIHCRAFNRLVPVLSLRQNNRDHRKYMIIDGEVAFTGGINMADEYINARPGGERRRLRPALSRLPAGRRACGADGLPEPHQPGQALRLHHHALPGHRLLHDHGPHHGGQVRCGCAHHHPAHPGQEDGL